MPLSVGTSLGNYEVTGSLGAGGMGEVYRARDSKLEREVAIKVLPDAFATDADRMARFEREAKLLAGLNHPNIATLHGLESIDGTHFLVMELVAGESLAERLSRGALSLDETLAIGRQVADALEAAHEKGVIHRDLKPANIQITPDDIVKVLDFGLAKAMTDDGGGEVDTSASPTMTRDATQAGMILGTAAYMSPEQARGKPVDRRADVFAFGCVLYEMLTGKKAFAGETVSDVLASVLKTEPDWSAVPTEAPSSLVKLLKRCLEKDPKRRLRDFGDAGIELRDAADEPVTTASANIVPSSVLAYMLIAAAAFAVAWLLARSSDSEPPRLVQRFTVQVPWDFDLAPLQGRLLALSPDGQELLLTVSRGGAQRIYRRSVSQFGWTQVPGTERGRNPSFSADGTSFAFRRERQIVVSDSTGIPKLLADARTDSHHWAEDDFVYYVDDDPPGVMRVSVESAESELLVDDVAIGDGGAFSRVAKLPNKNAVLFTHNRQFSADNDAWLIDFDNGERRVIIENANNPNYAASGHVVFARDDGLHAVAFDVESLTVSGTPRLVVEGVRIESGGAAQFTISQNGTLAYIPVSSFGTTRIMRVDRAGQARPVSEHAGSFRNPALSPDGTQLALVGMNTDGYHVWLLDLERDTLARTTFDGSNTLAIWSPDGSQLAISSFPPPGILITAPNRRRDEATMLDNPRRAVPRSWLPDGSGLIVATQDIAELSFDAPDVLRPLIDSSRVEESPVLSPDGRYLAYGVNQGSTASDFEIHVVGYPEMSPHWQISADGGREPRWSRDGRELYYRRGSAVMAVPVIRDGAFSPGRAELLFERPFETNIAFPNDYDVTPDGHFITVEAAESPEAPRLEIVLNWFDELEELVPTP